MEPRLVLDAVYAAGQGPQAGTFTPMSLIRIATVVALTGAVSLASACGGSAIDPDSGALGSTVDPTPTTAAATPTPTQSKSAKPPKDSPTPTAEGGDGDPEGDGGPATAGGGVCGDLGIDDVADAVGVAVSGSAIPGGGCKFDQPGNHGMSITILDKSASAAGGMSGAKTEATSAVEGEPQDLTGIGSAAFVVTGTMFGGTDVQGAGAVEVGSRIISVYLVQRTAIAGSKVRTMEINLLKLVVRAKG
jgi:hypothetical protein